jgi:hypothetical protein
LKEKKIFPLFKSKKIEIKKNNQFFLLKTFKS